MVSPTYGVMDITEIADKIFNFFNENKIEPEKYQIMIGTDSQASYNSTIFVTAIVVHRIDKGGIYFYEKTKENKTYSLADRIWKEAICSLDIANELLEEIKKLSDKNDIIIPDFEIHLDVGQNGKTKTLASSIVGVIKSYGFEAKIKPDSYASSTVADKYTK